MTRQQLIDLIEKKRSAYWDIYKCLRDDGYEESASMYYARYDEMDTLYTCLTDKAFARKLYEIWS